MAQISVRFFLLCLVIFHSSEVSLSIKTKQNGTPMHKVQLTQKGYIQFLRWELPVPEFSQFTFCLWMESNDLTHLHPIFSYSKNERERLVRSWISPHGKSIHLEIGGREVLVAPSDIHENRWYHFCLSWENQAGRYGLWVNGHIWTQGHSEQTIGQKIPSGGDIVLGQEYTDFDKGLEDGIEGSVLGFNLLLASAFEPLYETKASYYDAMQLPSASSDATVPLFARIPGKVMQRGIDYGRRTRTRTRTLYAFVPTSNQLRGRRYTDDDDRSLQQSRNRTRRETIEEEPLGLQLVKLSYVRCEIGRGSPFIGDTLMLISWTRTPVRIFGGAILKNVRSDCGNF
ncbi:Pentraxin-related protein PTX3 [Anthophora plagiata]